MITDRSRARNRAARNRALRERDDALRIPPSIGTPPPPSHPPPEETSNETPPPLSQQRPNERPPPPLIPASSTSQRDASTQMSTSMIQTSRTRFSDIIRTMVHLPYTQAPPPDASQNAPQVTVDNASRRRTVLTRNSYCSDLPNPTAQRWTVPVDDSVYFRIVDDKYIFHVLSAFASKKNRVIKTLDRVNLKWTMGDPENYTTGIQTMEEQQNLKENLRDKLKTIAEGSINRPDGHIGLCAVDASIRRKNRRKRWETFGHRILLVVLRFGNGLTYHIIDANGEINSYNWGREMKTVTTKFFQYVTEDRYLELQEFVIPNTNFTPSKAAQNVFRKLGITLEEPDLALCANFALIYAVELICTSGSLYPEPGRLERLVFEDLLRRSPGQNDTDLNTTDEVEIMLYSRALAFEVYKILYGTIDFDLPPPNEIRTVTVRRT